MYKVSVCILYFIFYVSIRVFWLTGRRHWRIDFMKRRLGFRRLSEQARSHEGEIIFVCFRAEGVEDSWFCQMTPSQPRESLPSLTLFHQEADFRSADQVFGAPWRWDAVTCQTPIKEVSWGEAAPASHIHSVRRFEKQPPTCRWFTWQDVPPTNASASLAVIALAKPWPWGRGEEMMMMIRQGGGTLFILIMFCYQE